MFKLILFWGFFCTFCYLVLQIAAVFVRLPDLFFQLFAALVLIGQLLRQQLAALSGFAQVLQCGGGFHLHSLGDILRYQRHSGQPKCGVRFLGGPRIFRQDSYLHHWLFSLLSVQLELQFPNPVLSFPQLLPSPPLALFSLSLQVWQLLGALLQGELQLLYSAAQVFILLRRQTTSVGVSPSVENHPPPHLSRASHLHEHGAGLWGNGGQLLQEALGDAQVLFQALVLCWQTQNSLLRVCRPLSDQNTTFSLMMGDKMWNTGCWVCFLQPKCFKHKCFKQSLALAHFKTYRSCSQPWELFLALLYTTLQLVNLSKTTYT